MLLAVGVWPLPDLSVPTGAVRWWLERPFPLSKPELRSVCVRSSVWGLQARVVCPLSVACCHGGDPLEDSQEDANMRQRELGAAWGGVSVLLAHP